MKVSECIMDRMERQRPFLHSLLRQGNKHKREVLIEHANKDQINSVSELVLNVLRKNVPVSPQIVRQLRPYKDVMCEISKRKTSLKRRKELLGAQTGCAFWRGLECCHRQCLR